MKPVRAILYVGILLTLAVSGSAIAAPNLQETSDAEVIYACARKSTGQLRLVDGPEDCKNNEVPISWNTVGPEGPQGPQRALLARRGQPAPEQW